MPKNSNEIQNNNKKQSNKKPQPVNKKKMSKPVKGTKKNYSKPSQNSKNLKKKTEYVGKTEVNKVKVKDKRQLNTNDRLFFNSYKSGKFKKKFLVLIIIIIPFLMIAIGVSFAYYLASVSVTNKDNAMSDMSSSGLVEASLDVKDKVSASNIYPGYQMAKKIILIGKGKKDYESIDAGIVIKPNLGVFKNDVIWKLYKSEKEITCTSNIIYNSSGIYDGSTCNIPSTAKLVLEGTYLENEYSVTVNYNTNDTYYLVVEYLNRDTDQSEQMNESFNIDIDLAAAGEQTIIKEIDHNVTLTNSVSSGGIKLSTLGDGVFELDGTSTASVNFRISDYYRASSPYNTYLYDATVPNNTIIMEKDKTYRISYEYIGGSNNVDGFNNFRLCFAEPNSYRGLQTFAYDFYSGFIGSEKLVDALKNINIEEKAKELNTDFYTLDDIVKSLLKPNRDPRDEMPKPILKSDVLHVEDLHIGDKLQGTVRNVVDFGLFIDIGLHNDGLAHISKLSKEYIKHPSELFSVGDIVDCYVIDIKKDQEKVSLSLIEE